MLQGRGRRTRHYLVDAQPIAGPDGETVGAVQAVQDVTRRRRAERFRICELAVATALAEAPSIEAAGPRVLEAVVGTLGLGARRAVAGRRRGRGGAPGRPVECARAGRPTSRCPAELPYGQGLAGRAWQVGKPLWIRDVGRPQSLISPETAETLPAAHRAGHPGAATGSSRSAC